MPRPSLPASIALLLAAGLTAAEMSLDQATLESESAEFGLGEGNHHFWGTVQFRYPAMLDLDCADLRILLIPGGQKIDRLIASNDVVMTLVQRGTNTPGIATGKAGATNRIHAAVAEYTATNDTVTLTGSSEFGQPWVEGAEGSFRADVITFDRAQDKIIAHGNFRLIVRPDALPKGALEPARPATPPPRPSVTGSANADGSSPKGAAEGLTALLEVRDLAKAYRARRVVNGVSIQVRPGEIVGLLGPNGAGKTTSFNMIVGVIRPDEGQVHFDGRDVTRRPMHERARLGIGYLTQEPSVFRKLTVEQNLLAILETCRGDREERATRLRYLLEELDLTPLARSYAYQLSGGEKRRLEITRALVTSPKLMLLDEPFAGIDPIAVYEVQKIVRRLRDRGLAILITDHNVRETLKIVDRAYLIHHGEVVYEGDAARMVEDPRAREIYLGPDFNL